MKPLDDAYANAPYIPDAESYPPRWQDAAAALRTALGSRAEVGVRYGPTDRQAVDLFQPDGAPQGTMVFVHGGYWKAFDRSVWSHLAKGAIDAGWSVAMPGYDLCPDVHIHQITQQIAEAIRLIASRTTGPITLAGHSAGGHLVSRMTDADVLSAAIRQRMIAVAPISPVADLMPLLDTSMNDVLQLDTAEALAESPTQQPVPEMPVNIWVGAAERPVFLEQAEALATAWQAPNVVVPDKHHFDIIEALEDRDSDMVRFLTGR